MPVQKVQTGTVSWAGDKKSLTRRADARFLLFIVELFMYFPELGVGDVRVYLSGGDR